LQRCGTSKLVEVGAHEKKLPPADFPLSVTFCNRSPRVTISIPRIL
jgi:hypothetical protein